MLLWSATEDERSLRRLQLAAETGSAFAFLFRPPSSLRRPSPAALRLALYPVEDGTCAERCNPGMVGLDQLAEADAIELRAMIEEHHRRTDSPVAQRVLDEWEATLPHFVKVMPADYFRALKDLEKERAMQAAE